MREREPIRVLHWGLDPVGLEIAKTVLRRSGMLSVGAIDLDSSRAGRDLGDLIGHGQHLGIGIGDDPEAVLTMARPDVTVICAGSHVDETAPLVLKAMEAGSNVLCVAAEMTYPWATRPDLADSLDELAHAHGVTVLGTGLNPGFVLDTLIMALTGCCVEVERIRASRVVDLDRLGEATAQAAGVGLSPSDYGAKAKRGSFGDASGLEQSIHLIADAVGWQLERIEQERLPIIAADRREGPTGRIQPGQLAGSHYQAIGYVDGMARILLEHPQQVDPGSESILTGDYIDIEGIPNIHLSIQPEIDGLKGTAGIAVNMIPMVIRSGPGLKTMADLPVPRAVLGDAREAVRTEGQTIDEELARGWHLEGLGGEVQFGTESHPEQ